MNVVDNELLTFYFQIFGLISFAGPVLAEAVKKIFKGSFSYYKGVALNEVRMNPVIIYSIVFVIDVASCLVFSFFNKIDWYYMLFIPPLVFGCSIIAYDVIIKNVLDIFELISSVIKRIITGNQVETQKIKENSTTPEISKDNDTSITKRIPKEVIEP